MVPQEEGMSQVQVTQLGLEIQQALYCLVETCLKFLGKRCYILEVWGFYYFIDIGIFAYVHVYISRYLEVVRRALVGSLVHEEKSEGSCNASLGGLFAETVIPSAL